MSLDSNNQKEKDGFLIKYLGIKNYEDIYKKMQRFAIGRKKEDSNEIWLLEHFPVYTQGIAGKEEHILNKSSIPIIKTDRGGQVTYHGPGQAIMYPLVAIREHKITARQLVNILENTVITYLESYDIYAENKKDAPGVYVNSKKIASLGLRVKKQCSYHGIALNVDVDLSPFSNINPCGYKGLQMTNCKELGIKTNVYDTLIELSDIFIKIFKEYQKPTK